MPSPLAAVEHRLLARFPDRCTDPARLAEFAETFGESCMSAAESISLVSDVMEPADLAGLAEHLMVVITSAIETSTFQLSVFNPPWLRQGQRWAVEAYFARIAEVRVTMVPGGRA